MQFVTFINYKSTTGIRRPRGSKEKPVMISASQNFATIIHPFAVDKEWFKGLSSKDMKKLKG